MARTRKQEPAQATSQEEFKCPECGRTFARAAALGAHRRQAHGVVGASTRSRSSGRRARAAAASTVSSSRSAAAQSRRRSPRTSAAITDDGRRRGVTKPDRDALLKTLFPNGIPPREEVIRAVDSWLADAERLAQMR